MKVRIDEICIGKRYRKNLQDIDSLIKSIKDIGLLQPIVVDSENNLIAGYRRLEAFKKMGEKAIPAHVVNLENAIKGEYDENVKRADYAITQELYKKEEAEARERQGERTDLKLSGKFPESGQTRDKAARGLGISGRTLEKIRQIVETGDKELIAEMDKKKKVDPIYRKLKLKEDEKKILSLKPKEGKYRTLIIDPPWDHGGFSLAGRGKPQYGVMTIEELMNLDVKKWAENGCHLYLWVTNNFLLEAGKLINHWGFKYKTILTWVKPKIGLGSYFRSSTEHCLFAIFGKEITTRVHNIPTHFEAPVGEHSEKPPYFYDNIVKKASYPPYGEAFQRKNRVWLENLYEQI